MPIALRMTSSLPASAEEALAALDPLARAWFEEKFGAPTEAQRYAWPAIARGANALLVAPTGSGKTLASFLQLIGRLANEATTKGTPDKHGVRTPSPGIRVLYISPLRALDADVHHNLREPLAGIARLAAAGGTPIAIDHAVRTGDTSQRDRRAAQKHPPHLLITTPESLFQLLGSDASRATLARVETVIVDELHAIADGKRGTHLAVSLERLEDLCGRPVQRIGLTATAEPLDALAALLVGDPETRPVELLDARRARSIALSVEAAPRVAEAGKDARIERVADHVARAERSLVFVGSRALAERWRPALEKELHAKVIDSGSIGIHHGALAREVREVVEAGLREGTLRAVVATSSLELGIDIGAIDQVVQVGTPGGVARLLQRVGRAGHSPGATSRGVIVSRGGVDLLECALLAKLALRGALEPVRIPRGALDVLAQQLVATAAAAGTGGITLDAFLAMARRAYPYSALTRESVVRLVEALSSGHLRAPRLEWDRATGVITTPESARKIARMSGGTITSRGHYRMLDADSRETIGELDEEFVHESKPGDRFSFGLGVYRIASIRPDAVLVRRAPPGSARMPFWRGDRPMRAASTGILLGRSLDAIEPVMNSGDEALRAALVREFPITPHTAESLGDLLTTQSRATRLPTERTLVVESFADQLGEPRIAIHCWLGRTVLEPWALALAARMESRLGGAVHAAATDNGILIAPPKGPPLEPGEVPRMISAREIRAIVETILPRTAIAGAAFREAAERSLLLPRMPFKKRTPLWMNRQRARDLMLAIGEDPNHPIVAEALRDVMNDRWDTAALEAYLARIDSGDVVIHHVERKTPSLFARGLEEAFKSENLYEDDTPAGERLAKRASGTQGHDAEGTFDAPLDLVGIAEPADRGALAGLAPELPMQLLLLRAQGPVSLDDLARHLALTEESLRARLIEPVSRGEIVIGRFIERPPGDLTLEACDTEVLSRLRRRALSRARRQVEPVSRRAFQRWLLERMAVGPFAGEGDEAVTRAVSQLAMYPIPPECLERDLLRVRVQRYDPALLDLACARGEVRYVLLEDPARIVVAPASSITPFPPATSRVTGEWADRLRDVLRERGALFFGDLVLASRLPVTDAAEVLSKMLRAGEVTNDAFVPARTLATGGAGKGKPVGRYALRASVPVEASTDALIERLLARYGVVARPLVDLEELAPSWGAMREELDRREARGEVRRGTVVDGLGPVQFARTETIESLRATRSDVMHAPVLLSARDPALVAEVGGIGRSSTTRVVVRDGEPLAVCERDGAVIRTLRDLDAHDADAVVDALRGLARLPAVLRPFRALMVERVDDRPAPESVLGAALAAQGFERDGERMTLPSFRG